jgi:cell division protein YceG involved in septum cleavage
MMSDSKKIDYIQEKVDSVAEVACRIDKAQALQQAAFDAHTKQDEQMYGELRRMNDILQSNTESLKEHMSNNALLKDMIHKMDQRLDPIEREFIEKTAVKSWVLHKVKFISKVGAAVGFLAGAWVWLWPALQHLIR